MPGTHYMGEYKRRTYEARKLIAGLFPFGVRGVERKVCYGIPRPESHAVYAAL
jgi:hypothetical protein